MSKSTPSVDEHMGTSAFPTAGGRMCICVPGLTAHLRELKIGYVRMEYEGANGRGHFVHMEYVRTDGTQVDSLSPTLHATVLQAVFQSVLASRHPDWNERDGSTGDFRWDVSRDSLIHTHYARGGSGNERVCHHNL